MKRYVPVLLLLTACNPSQQAKVQTVGADIKSVASGILVAADAACKDALPVLGLVSGLIAGNPKITSLVSYASSVCSPAGVVIPGTHIDATTAAWIGGIKAALAFAANLRIPVTSTAPSTPVAVPTPAAAPVTVAVPVQ